MTDLRMLSAAAVALLWTSSATAADLSGEVGVVSDYRYRGVSLSEGNPAVQASLTLEHGSGVYVTVWGSTLERIGRPSNSEVDITAGYEREVNKWISFDLSATRYSYPSAGDDNYSEATAAVTLTRGPASAIIGFSYAPRQRGLRDESGRRHDNSYASLQTAYAVRGTPLTLKAGLGHERGAFDEVERGGKWDWNLGGEATRGPAKLSLTYVGSNVDGGDRHALVGGLSFTW